MLTLFTAPKAFEGHNGVIQRNAIESWLKLTPTPEIIILGKDAGCAEICQEFNLKHIPDLENSIPPLISDIFAKAKSLASNDYICFVNTDILLFDDFMESFDRVRQKCDKFLMVSSRYNIDVEDGRTDYKKQALEKIDMYPAAGSDFFLFPKNLYKEIPPFFIGRGYWDNWLMYEAKRLGAYLVDATHDVVAVHQNHDYAHISGINTGNRDEKYVFNMQQGQRNLVLAGGRKNLYTNYDADFVLVDGKLKPSLSLKYIKRRLKSVVRRALHVLFK
jgi:hypothetical protein